jgi:hypothetical protein
MIIPIAADRSRNIHSFPKFVRVNIECRGQVIVIPMRVNVNLKAVTVEDLIARRKVLFEGRPY